MKSSEGEVPFCIAKVDKLCHTWYKTFGDLDPQSTPLMAIHGGPGACHEYMLSMADLSEYYGIPMILHDQIGNAKSTGLKEKAGDEAFWVEGLFCAELDNLIEYFQLRDQPGGFSIIGQSWAGMFASKWAASHPKGLRKLVLADSPASTALQLRGEMPLRKALPEDV